MNKEWENILYNLQLILLYVFSTSQKLSYFVDKATLFPKPLKTLAFQEPLPALGARGFSIINSLWISLFQPLHGRKIKSNMVFSHACSFLWHILHVKKVTSSICLQTKCILGNLDHICKLFPWDPLENLVTVGHKLNWRWCMI